ncbi:MULTISPECIES: GNAT family N-acetyltransferase [unclassified Granulicatella]|jgi:acetyltransferase, GNAT family|uniref:GNAT family N-acetyltransferase n=1 Tax=unclassified Granulicatella TaxID=2630493 RepID=UPI002556BCDE|nr:MULTISPECIES: GNAT family N-acetyltransferase [unclassified Granulicatella]MDK8380567.1 GNAT family N-acetyltransferase [Granulicatella sp. UMB5615B]MDK8522628.1 GNAT family N-acetyltransferase [Granulicatella sp. UMB5615A]
MIRTVENPIVTLEDVLPLYEAVGWTNYTTKPEMLEVAYKNSLHIIGAFNDDEKLIGVLRGVGDGASILFIQDILVYPEYQHQGIGTKLLQQTLEKHKNVYQIQLATDDSTKTVSFYESNGFTNLTSLNCVSFIYTGKR